HPRSEFSSADLSTRAGPTWYKANQFRQEFLDYLLKCSIRRARARQIAAPAQFFQATSEVNGGWGTKIGHRPLQRVGGASELLGVGGVHGGTDLGQLLGAIPSKQRHQLAQQVLVALDPVQQSGPVKDGGFVGRMVHPSGPKDEWT